MKLQRILVLLDGSGYAEQILKYGLNFSNLAQSELLLAHATGVFTIGQTESNWKIVNEWELYLNKVREFLIDPSLPTHLEADKVKTIVVYDKPVEEIADIAAFEKADLIMMTTHGRCGLSKQLANSITSRVIRDCNLPIVVLRPEQEEYPLLSNNNSLSNLQNSHGPIVVALDGEPKAELILEPAITMARLTGAQIHLLHIIDYNQLMRFLNLDLYVKSEDGRVYRQKATKYLRKVQDKIEEAGVACQIAIGDGTIVEQIVEYSNSVEAQMVAMATHSHGLADRVIFGSISESLMEYCHVPILLVNMHRYTTL